MRSYECCIFGAGAAGLGAALELVKHGVSNILIVDRNNIVGGLARTECFDGVRFDVGPHRFYTKNNEINALWHKTLGKDFQRVSRLSRIYYNNHYFNYPLKLTDVFGNFGLWGSFNIGMSFLAEQCKIKKEAKTFEDWVVQKFGRKLYEIFFKVYAEKVWGIPCREIGAEWAAQRIRGLNVTEVLKKALFPHGGQKIKTLVDEFDYPVLGAGQMYEAMTQKVVAAGAQVMLGTAVIAFRHRDNKITSVIIQDKEGQRQEVAAGHYFNSIPLTHFFKMLDPVLEAPVSNAVQELYYREHITVNLLVDKENVFPDQWLYIHSPEVRTARIANYNNFSAQMVGRSNKTALSMEYFTFQQEDLWQLSDDDLRRLASEELVALGLVERAMVEKAWVVRETETYPVYFQDYRRPYQLLKERIDRFENVSPIGRGGLYKYNNQDHSTLSGLVAVRNYLKLSDKIYSVWDINEEDEYLEDHERVSR